MHNRIFQLEKMEDINAKTISKINANTFLERTNLINTIADYIADIEDDDSFDLKNEYDWFAKNLISYGAVYNKEDNTITFPKNFKYNYFKNRFTKFKETVQSINLDDFVDDSTISFYGIKELINNEFGFYICNSNYEFDTLDNFIRGLAAYKKHTYKLITVLDYHFQ